LLDLQGTRPGEHDQVAVVGFNDAGWIEIGLSNNRSSIESALNRLPDKIEEGTRLDLAFEVGQSAFSGPSRKPDNAAVMIVLTDGIPNRVPFPPGSSQEAVVLAAADSAKSAGTRIFTIGLGQPDDIIEWLLRDCASEPSDEHYFYAPDGDDLEDIYRQIARLLPCPGVEPWPPETSLERRRLVEEVQ
jgi:Mg-chelatase subunit ChlD